MRRVFFAELARVSTNM